MKHETKIEFLDKDDIFFLDGKKYTVTLNENLSSSFNQLHTLYEGEEYNLRLRKNETVWVEQQQNISKNINKSRFGVDKIRNEKGTIVAVNFGNSILTERKLSKSEIEKRDDCVKALMDNPKFVKTYKKMSNVHHPGRTIDDVAYGTCTMHAKGEKTKQREKEGFKRKDKKKKTNESFERLNTIKKAIRRTSE